MLRLLGISDDEFEMWLAAAQRSDGDILERLRRGWRAIRPEIAQPPGSPVSVGKRQAELRGPGGRFGEVWIPAIAEDSSFGFAASTDADMGWLIRWDGASWERVIEPPQYEEAYFEGSRDAGGYTDYLSEAGWRIEKARRQAREISRIDPGLTGPVLDIGSGYGYFRQALTEYGFESEGLEVSAHARKVADEVFGQDTTAGTLAEVVDRWPEHFELVTAFDLIEHVPDYQAFLSDIRNVLRPGGLCCLKTPNIACPESYVFEEYYHSLKREHLVLFTPSSLTKAAKSSGFSPVEVTTTSHLLKGFVGDELCRRWGETGRGSDIVAWFRRSY